MNTSAWFLLIVCLVLSATRNASEHQLRVERHEENLARQIGGNGFQDAADSEQDSVEDLSPNIERDDEPEYKTEEAEGRSILETSNRKEHEDVDSINRHAAFKKRAKPLKNIFMGIYKNYKSTYLGNRTSLEYKNTLRDRIIASSKHTMNPQALKLSPPEELHADDLSQEMHFVISKDSGNEETEQEAVEGDGQQKSQQEERKRPLEHHKEVRFEQINLKETHDVAVSKPTQLASAKESFLPNLAKKRRKHKNARKSKPRKHLEKQPHAGGDNEYRYQVGSGFNMSLDLTNDIVGVKLDGVGLHELIAGRWLDDNTEQGRGKKYDMMTKVLPLFILPFLIQSAIIPFLVTKLKLLLIKSMLVGKLAIFLLIISAFRNSNKMTQTYEVAPSHWAGEPSRRSEVPATASSAPYSGYRVEGKPAAWIN